MIQYQRLGHGLLGAGEAVSGRHVALGNPGFDGLGLNLDIFPGIGRTPQFALSPTPRKAQPRGLTATPRWCAARRQAHPRQHRRRRGALRHDGDHRQARPTRRSSTGRATRSGIRLNSLVFRVKRASAASTRKVDYLAPRQGRRVEARHVVTAAGTGSPPTSSRGCPRSRSRALLRPQGAADLRARRPQQLAGVRRRQGQQREPARQQPLLGQHHAAGRCGLRLRLRTEPNDPASPASVSFTVVATDHRATPQLAAYEGGRKRLLEMSFRDLERAFVDVLDRTLNMLGGDFEPERDIDPLMINCWNYGYAHEMTSVWDPSLYGPVERSHRRSAASRTVTSRSPAATRRASPARRARSTRATGGAGPELTQGCG